MLAPTWRITLHSKLMKTLFLILFFPALALGAPVQNTTESDAAKKLIQIDKSTEGQKIENADFFFTDTQSICIYGGTVYALNPENSLFYGIWGVTYTFPSQTRFHLESSFDILTNQEGHLRLMGRWNSRMSEKLRPYINAGLGIKVLPNDNVGVLLSWGRVIAQIGTGIEWSFTQHTSIRAEAFAGAGLSTNSFAAAILGYSLSF